ncbi:hypothetical protein ACFVTC_01135 [Streptomyces sp. NPDC057950]|uniref:hypothetical protein n=1 Tax=Streptomyces sp. NPDC057950 TaxID=3346288 RepID=UPI0036E8603E
MGRDFLGTLARGEILHVLEVVEQAGRIQAGVVADNEVEGVPADMDGAAEAAFAVEQDVDGLADPLGVVRPQNEEGGAGHSDARGELSLAQFLAEARPVLVGAEVATRVERSGGDVVRPQPDQLAGGYVSLSHGLRATVGRVLRASLNADPVPNRSATLISTSRFESSRSPVAVPEMLHRGRVAAVQ